MRATDPPVNIRTKTCFFSFKKITYNYSEAGHGKNAADGIGAALKRTADDLVKYGADIPDFETFCKLMIEKNLNIIISIVTRQDIDAVNKKLPKNLKSIPGTRQVYQIRWNSKFLNVIHFNYLSCFDCSTDKVCIHSSKNKFVYDLKGVKLNLSEDSKVDRKILSVPRNKVQPKIECDQKLMSHKVICNSKPKAAEKSFTIIKTEVNTCLNASSRKSTRKSKKKTKFS